MPHSLRDLYIEELQDPLLCRTADHRRPAAARLGSHIAGPRARVRGASRADDGSSRAPRPHPEEPQRPAGAAITAKGWQGLIKEGRERLRQDSPSDVKDAALISAAQRVEHYEIAGYGTARTYAGLLGDWEGERLLQQTLDEEGATDHRLTDLATSGINQDAGDRDDAGGGRQWSRLRYLDVDDLDDSTIDYRKLTIRGRTGEDLGSLDGFVVETATAVPSTTSSIPAAGSWAAGI